MLPTLKPRADASHLRLLGTTCLLVALTACGGGGGNPGSSGGTGTGTGTGSGTTPGSSTAVLGTVAFVSSDLDGSSIVLKGSGGLGRKESALLTFRVLDQNNKGLAGVEVVFAATTSTGGLTVQPAKGTTDVNGEVTTTVVSGSVPTPVRVSARATRDGKEVTGLSDTLVISTGLPIQRFMSMSVDSFNIEGWRTDGVVANVTVRLADQYGNPISDSTAVNFVTEGGAIGTSLQGACLTVNGACSVTLKSQNFRPINGRVSVLAYVQGLENFVDLNGDGQYSCTNFTDAKGAVPAVYRPLSDVCVSGGEPFTDQGDPFLDTGLHQTTFGLEAVGQTRTFDGQYDGALGDLPIPYNRSAYSATGNGKWGANYIWASEEITFSGPEAYLVRQVCTGSSCRDWTSGDGEVDEIKGLQGVSGSCSTQELVFRLTDVNNNPMPHKTTLTTTDAQKLTPLTLSPKTVPSTPIVGGTIHRLRITPDSACAAGSFAVTVTTPADKVSSFTFKSAP